MLRLVQGDTTNRVYESEIHASVLAFLNDRFSAESTPIRGLDRWTRQRVTVESLAKVSLALEADDSVEYCYQNLIREIDTEAETGVFLANPSANAAHLRYLAGESGISGRLFQRLGHIAPKLFANEMQSSGNRLDMVWSSIEARYDRANVDAEVSELIMLHLLSDEDAAVDMSDALRAVMYTVHEDLVRRRCDLPRLINDSEATHLMNIASEMGNRAGNYSDRRMRICERANLLAPDVSPKIANAS